MKILLINDTHETYGGAENFFFNLKKKLIERNYNVLSLGFSNNLSHDDRSIVFPISKNRFLRGLNRIIFNPFMYFKIKKAIKKFDPDIINLFNTNNYTPTLFKAISGYKVLQSILDYRLICPVFTCDKDERLHICDGIICKNKYLIKNPLKQFIVFYQHKLFRKLTIKSISYYYTPSPHLKHCLELNDFHPIEQIPLFLTFKKGVLNFDNVNFNSILYVGQIEVNKGIWDLVYSIKDVTKFLPKICLKIAGNGSQFYQIEKFIIKNKLEKNIKLLGPIRNLKPLYEECCLLIVPSTIQESFGFVTAEAMFNSRAVLGSNRGATTWLVKDNITGEIFDPEKNELSEKIISLLNNKKKLMRYGLEAKKRITKIANTKKILEQIINLYKKNLYQ